MVNVMGSTTLGVVPVTDGRNHCMSIDMTKAERWLYLQDGATQLPLIFQFTTPIEMPKEERCGKVVFSDMHVASGSFSSAGLRFPQGCSSFPMSPQEKALAFMFFDIGSCVTACTQPTLSIVVSNGLVTISWTGEAGRTYQVQSTTDLGAGAAGWHNEGNPLSGTGTLHYTTPTTGPQRFFRVVCS